MKRARIPGKTEARRMFSALVLGALLLAGCAQRVHREVVDVDEHATLDRRARFLKVHLRDGGLYSLQNWNIDDAASTIRGHGVRFGPNRGGGGSGDFTVPFDSVALLETNVVVTSPSMAAITVVAIASVGVTVACAINPKACFGSCPTFYVTDGTRERLQAEGFSASVAPALEATDIDALYRARPSGRVLHLRMTNEALETHVIRRADVLAALRPAGGRVLASPDGVFHAAFDAARLRRATGRDGDCTAALAAFDGHEHFTTTDSTDLAARNTLELEFDGGAAGPLGLRLATRQTLVTTYVFYQTLGYLGSRAGDLMAELARGSPFVRDRLAALQATALGGIEVMVQDARGGWISAGRAAEIGPIATDVRVVPLPAGWPEPPSPAGAAAPATAASAPLRVRLCLARGAWRIDAVDLVHLADRVEPQRIAPRAVHRGAEADAAALAALRSHERPLVSLPGDEWTLEYELPVEGGDCELFLESRGYYLEWMREEWRAEEDVARAVRFFADPRQAMRELAPGFKRIEPHMETLFWESRYEKR